MIINRYDKTFSFIIFIFLSLISFLNPRQFTVSFHNGDCFQFTNSREQFAKGQGERLSKKIALNVCVSLIPQI